HYHTYPHQYLTSLAIGMLTGFLIVKHPRMQMHGGACAKAFLWVISIVSIGTIFIWNWFILDADSKDAKLESLIWFVGSKFMLSISLGFVCYMCCSSKGMAMIQESILFQSIDLSN